MHLMFETIGKLANAYAAFHNSVVYVPTEDGNLRKESCGFRGKTVQSVCAFSFAEDGEEYARSFFGGNLQKMTFGELTRLAKAQGFQYVAYENDGAKCWPLETMERFVSAIRSEPLRSEFLQTYPGMAQGLDRLRSGWEMKIDDYWSRVPLKEVFDSFFRLQETDGSSWASFESDGNIYWLNVSENTLWNEDRSISVIPSELLDSGKFDEDIYEFIAKRFGVWRERYLDPIDWAPSDALEIA